MRFSFTKKDIEKIAKVLGIDLKKIGDCYRGVLENHESNRRLSLEIYSKIPIGKQIGNLISVYTPNAHLQLHFCTGYVVSESLGEVTFIGEFQGRLSGLIVEKGASCSLYANVDRSILSGDFTQLGPEVMLSGIALSLTEQVLPASR
ncbi:hypothetical protein DRQ15_04700 [candidate division KSB1 bacterium]|nr:hypothetical protein [bacterium]RKY73526.1 MAG: hypothetical protein DRQ00_12375 [candidate division KSB1 bacterium]RKY86835.1 MAG: hypothetical protein DRQ11_07610 [candidate division KSB1 bacterium]RKY91552.1 MAG: hypothetical protein DRQ15_04700 [candidate division KSB1 bacterium]